MAKNLLWTGVFIENICFLFRKRCTSPLYTIYINTLFQNKYDKIQTILVSLIFNSLNRLNPWCIWNNGNWLYSGKNEFKELYAIIFPRYCAADLCPSPAQSICAFPNRNGIRHAVYPHFICNSFNAKTFVTSFFGRITFFLSNEHNPKTQFNKVCMSKNGM